LDEFEVTGKLLNLGKWFVEIFYCPEPALA